MTIALNSALMCRQQEALHRQRAAETPLAHVRAVALRAAALWGRQAVEAADIEAGVRRLLSAEDAAIALEFLIEDAAEPTEPANHVVSEGAAEATSIRQSPLNCGTGAP